MEETLDFLPSNKSCRGQIGLENVPTKGAVTKFRKRMGTDFNRILGLLIAYIHDCMNFDDLDRFHVVLFTKCYFGNRRFPRMSKEMDSHKFVRYDKKIHRTATKWAGFNLMLYVLYGLGFVNILEDMKVEKRSNCVYTPLQISLAYIVKMILGFKNAYCLDEELEEKENVRGYKLFVIYDVVYR
ncbi:MAG: hypothetical protein ACNYVW_02090, partial [Methanosarcinales archaeon]